MPLQLWRAAGHCGEAGWASCSLGVGWQRHGPGDRHVSVSRCVTISRQLSSPLKKRRSLGKTALEKGGSWQAQQNLRLSLGEHLYNVSPLSSMKNILTAPSHLLLSILSLSPLLRNHPSAHLIMILFPSFPSNFLLKLIISVRGKGALPWRKAAGDMIFSAWGLISTHHLSLDYSGGRGWHGHCRAAGSRHGGTAAATWHGVAGQTWQATGSAARAAG